MGETVSDIFHVWRLREGADAERGLACDEIGLRFGGVALIEQGDAGYRIRAEAELARLLAATYGAGADNARLMPGPGFTTLHVPSKDIPVPRDAFKATLRAMYDADEGDAGLVFSR